MDNRNTFIWFSKGSMKFDIIVWRCCIMKISLNKRKKEKKKIVNLGNKTQENVCAYDERVL